MYLEKLNDGCKHFVKSNSKRENYSEDIQGSLKDIKEIIKTEYSSSKTHPLSCCFFKLENSKSFCHFFCFDVT